MSAPEKRSDQRLRSLSPKDKSALKTEGERNPSPQHITAGRARCGWTNVIQSRRDPSIGRTIWTKCKRRVVCPHCGPQLRQRDLERDLAVLDGHPVVRALKAQSAWVSVRARIKRAGGTWRAYPQPGGMLAVYATAGMLGEPVAELAGMLAGDYDRMPRRQRIHRKAPDAKPANLEEPAVKPERPDGWRSLGMGGIPPEEVPGILRKRGVWTGQVPADRVPASAWEVHQFTCPPTDSREFVRLAFELALHQPDRAGQYPRSRRAA
jgi:hypothetical protein